jgi:uncharacterized protein (DUF4415 family)
MLNDNSEQARRERLLAMYGELDEAEIASYLALGWDRPAPTAEEVARMSPAERNKGGRPRGSGSREQITLRVGRDVIARFRALGSGWQTRMNEALRKAAKSL